MATSGDERKLIFIVGMHRSGTSALGKLLQSAKADFGGNLLDGIEDINDEGFWEDREFVAFNEYIFKTLCSSWYDFERLPGKWWEDDRIKELAYPVENWFRETFANSSLMALKDPRLCRLLPFWKRFFQNMDINPKVLFVYRHPEEVALSLQKRDGFSLEVGYLLWLIYNIDALYYSRTADLHLLDYSQLIKSSEHEISRLKEACPELELNNVNFREILDAGRKHQEGAELNFDNKEMPIKHLASELYATLQESDDQGAKKCADKFRKRLYRLLDHHKEMLSSLQDSTYQLVSANQKLHEIGGSHSYALSTIGSKDHELEKSNEYIASCEARIQELDSILSSMGDKVEGAENIEKVIVDREKKLAENLEYILRCEKRIQEQDHLLNQLGPKIEELENLEKALLDREGKLTENSDYIAKCDARIQEQDQIIKGRDAQIKENKTYIDECSGRIAEQDFMLRSLGRKAERLENVENALVDRETKLQQNAEYIEKCAQRIQEQDDLLKDLGARAERLELVEAELLNKERLLIEHAESLSESNERINALEAGVQENTVYIDRCHGRISELDSDVERLSNERQQFESEVLDMRNLFELHQQRVQLQKKQINRLKNELTICKEELYQHIEEGKRKGDKIDWYRDHMVVRALDKFFYKEPS